jgi:FAD dependent oxidoreductase
MQLRSVILAALGTSTASANVFDGSFGGKGLSGSHFGIPGLPAAFDYVVIGGGTAGLAVARRLAANASVTVAVIEAGDFYEFSNGNLSQIPAYASKFTGNDPTEKNPYLDWYHYTEPQPVSVGFVAPPRLIGLGFCLS